MPQYFSGLNDFNFYQSTAQDYLRKSFAANLIRYQPNGMCPLFGLSGMLGDETALSVEHGYFAKTMLFSNCTSTGGQLIGDTTFTVDATASLLPGDLLRVQATGEIVRVLTIISSTQFTCARAVGQIAAQAVPNPAALYGVGNAFEQGSQAPQSRLMNPVRVSNFTQIFRNSWALPGTMQATTPIAGNNLTAESREDCGMFHGRDIETALLWGQKSSGNVNGQWMTTTDGLVEQVRRLASGSNTSVAGGTTNYTQLQNYLEPQFNIINNGRNGNDRIIFVGGTARRVINDIGRLSGQYFINNGETNFGLKFQQFYTARGTFKMIEHPLLNSNADWAKMAISVDLPSVKVAYLRRTKNEEFGMDGRYVQFGQDAVGGTLTTELATQIYNPNAHAIIYGLTAGVAG